MATHAHPPIHRSSTDASGRRAFGGVLLATRLSLVSLFRRRLTVLLLVIVPALFSLVVIATTSSRAVPIELAALSGEAAHRVVDERALTLVFMGTAAASFLTCFLAFHLTGKRRDVDARLVLAGLSPSELLASKLLVLSFFVVALSVYETAMLLPWFDVRSAALAFAGLFLGGLVYGCVGLLVGATGVRELEGIFVIVLLTNVDVGWLQNPVYYASSERRWIIEALPGHAPAQVAIVGALTDATAPRAAWIALASAGVVLAIALLVFALRLPRRRRT